MNFKEQLEQRTCLVEERLADYMPKENKYPEILYQAMRYSLFAGGKRLRPVLLLSIYEAYQRENLERAMPFACAMEMIHTYSLIHDDLPAMDNDDYRRGKLTNHKMFGENFAILAGDGLLNHAFLVMADAAARNQDQESILAMQKIAYHAGCFGMIGGQAADVLNEGKKIDQGTLDFIHKNKTAALIKAALAAGAILGGAKEQEIVQIEQAGEKLGIAFQVQDDILDVTSTIEVLGKPVYSDEKNEKTTYVTLFGIEESKHIVKKLSDEAISLLQEANGATEFLVSLIQQMAGRNY